MAVVETVADLMHNLCKGPQGQKLMGIDLGSKTIGMACSDTSHTIATAYDTIRRTKFAADAQALEAVLAKEDIGGLVVGLPLNMDGSEGARVQATRAFIRNLQARDDFPDLPILLWDERLSTAAVTRTLLAADTSRAKRTQVIDKIAAAYILQGVLDNWQNNPA